MLVERPTDPMLRGTTTPGGRDIRASPTELIWVDIDAHVKCDTNTTPVIRRNNIRSDYIRRNNGDHATDWDREYRKSV
jgi:hypothetical protein